MLPDIDRTSKATSVTHRDTLAKRLKPMNILIPHTAFGAKGFEHGTIHSGWRRERPLYQLVRRRRFANRKKRLR